MFFFTFTLPSSKTLLPLVIFLFRRLLRLLRSFPNCWFLYLWRIRCQILQYFDCNLSFKNYCWLFCVRPIRVVNSNWPRPRDLARCTASWSPSNVRRTWKGQSYFHTTPCMLSPHNQAKRQEASLHLGKVVFKIFRCKTFCSSSSGCAEYKRKQKAFWDTAEANYFRTNFRTFWIALQY